MMQAVRYQSSEARGWVGPQCGVKKYHASACDLRAAASIVRTATALKVHKMPEPQCACLYTFGCGN